MKIYKIASISHKSNIMNNELTAQEDLLAQKVLKECVDANGFFDFNKANVIVDNMENGDKIINAANDLRPVYDSMVERVKKKMDEASLPTQELIQWIMDYYTLNETLAWELAGRAVKI